MVWELLASDLDGGQRRACGRTLESGSNCAKARLGRVFEVWMRENVELVVADCLDHATSDDIGINAVQDHLCTGCAFAGGRFDLRILSIFRLAIAPALMNSGANEARA